MVGVKLVGVVMVVLVMVEVVERGVIGKSGRPFRERTTAVKLWQEHLAWLLHRATASSSACIASQSPANGQSVLAW